MEDLFNRHLALIENKILVEAKYGDDNTWYYDIISLPSDEDVVFALSGECQDGNLWLHSNVFISGWEEHSFSSYIEAFRAGIEYAEEWF